MATQQKRRSQNIEGEFYVDSSCIDCDTCRWLAPEIFHRQGDQSLAFSAHLGHLIGFKNHCWYSWTEQIKSLKKLLDYPITWILLGHGRRYHASAEKMKREIQYCIQWMEQA